MRLADLGLEPIDLLVGGRNEVALRAKHSVVTNWTADLGTLPEEKLAEYLNQKRKLTVDVPPATQALLDDAEELRRAVSQGRPLEPGDFAAAADAGKPLTDDVERNLVNAAATTLAARATMLAARLSADAAALLAAAGPVVAAARNHARLVAGGSADVEVVLAVAHLTQLRTRLDAALLKVSFHAEPSALRLMTTTSIAAAPNDLERALLGIAARLTNRQANLTAAASAAPGTNAAEAHERRDTLIAALKDALDGDALPILAPISRVPETSPLLQPGAGPAADPASGWAPVREKVARALALFGAAPWKEHRTADAATGADAADADLRPESLAPRARLYGTFLAQAPPDTVGAFVGFVVDEWAEQRPSEAQQTGIAINYDAPQSEPPHVLLLAEPTSSAPWSIDGAAKIVAHTVALMKSRAVSAQERPLPGAMLPHANQVPGKLVANRSRARIPATALRFIASANRGMDGSFVLRQDSTNVGVDGVGLSEVDGFGKVKD